MSVTVILIIITFGLSYFCFNNQAWFNKLKHYPIAEHQNKEYYRMITSGFIHGSWIHLLINVFVLFSFGDQVENIFVQVFGSGMGHGMYLLMYLLTIIAADIPTHFQHKNNPHYAAIGASGAVSGVVFVYILFYPWNMLYIYGILPVPAILGGIGYLFYSSWASKNRNDNIGHSAHFYGALFGMLFILVSHPETIKIFFNKLSQLPF